jgi:integrase
VRQVLKEAVRRQWITRNVAEGVKVPKAATEAAEAHRAARQPWDAAEVQTFLAAIASTREYAVILLSLLGMRPAEVCGLTWSHVDLDAGTLTIASSRTEVHGHGTITKAPKTRAGRRTLSLPAPVLAALRALKATQRRETTGRRVRGR